MKIYTYVHIWMFRSTLSWYLTRVKHVRLPAKIYPFFGGLSIPLLFVCLCSFLWCVVIEVWFMAETCYWMSTWGGYMLHYIHYLFVFLKGVIRFANFHYFARLSCSFRTCPNLFVLCFGLSSRLKDSRGITCLERDVYRLYTAHRLDCVMPYHLRQLLQLTDALPMNPRLFKFSFEFLPCSSTGVDVSQWVRQLVGL